jgi:hypothetical protein
MYDAFGQILISRLRTFRSTRTKRCADTMAAASDDWARQEVRDLKRQVAELTATVKYLATTMPFEFS